MDPARARRGSTAPKKHRWPWQSEAGAAVVRADAERRAPAELEPRADARRRRLGRFRRTPRHEPAKSARNVDAAAAEASPERRKASRAAAAPSGRK